MKKSKIEEHQLRNICYTMSENITCLCEDAADFKLYKTMHKLKDAEKQLGWEVAEKLKELKTK